MMIPVRDDGKGNGTGLYGTITLTWSVRATTAHEAGQHCTVLLDSCGEVRVCCINDDTVQQRKGELFQRQARQYGIV